MVRFAGIPSRFWGGMRYRQARQASLRTLTLEPLLRGVVQDGMQEGMEENEDRRN